MIHHCQRMFLFFNVSWNLFSGIACRSNSTFSFIFFIQIFFKTTHSIQKTGTTIINYTCTSPSPPPLFVWWFMHYTSNEDTVPAARWTSSLCISLKETKRFLVFETDLQIICGLQGIQCYGNRKKYVSTIWYRSLNRDRTLPQKSVNDMPDLPLNQLMT